MRVRPDRRGCPQSIAPQGAGGRPQVGTGAPLESNELHWLVESVALPVTSRLTRLPQTCDALAVPVGCATGYPVALDWIR